MPNVEVALPSPTNTDIRPIIKTYRRPKTMIAWEKKLAEYVKDMEMLFNFVVMNAIAIPGKNNTLSKMAAVKEIMAQLEKLSKDNHKLQGALDIILEDASVRAKKEFRKDRKIEQAIATARAIGDAILLILMRMMEVQEVA